MATYYLINSVQLGQTKYFPGAAIDSVNDNVTAIQAAGGVLVASSDTYIAAAAVVAQAIRLRGGEELTMAEIMSAAYDVSLTASATALVAADIVLTSAVNSIAPANEAVMTGVVATACAIGVPFIIRRTYIAGGATGTGDDVVLMNSNAPFKFRVLDVFTITTTEIGGSSATLRDTAGGAGNALSSALSSATKVTARNALVAATGTVAAGGSLILARTDRATVGEIVITAVREA